MATSQRIVAAVRSPIDLYLRQVISETMESSIKPVRMISLPCNRDVLSHIRSLPTVVSGDPIHPQTCNDLVNSLLRRAERQPVRGFGERKLRQSIQISHIRRHNLTEPSLIKSVWA